MLRHLGTPRRKEVVWVGRSLDDLRRLPADTQRSAGFELGKVQQGEMPSDWRPMSSIGPGVIEIRVRTALEHRLVYIATIGDVIHVLHVFEKKTQKTRPADLELARRRLAWVRSRAKMGEP